LLSLVAMTTSVPFRSQWYGFPIDVATKASNITQMNVTWPIPGLPLVQKDQIIRIWAGLKNEQPAIGYPALLTVLVYDGTNNPNWTLTSSFVWSNNGIFIRGNTISASPGDMIKTSIYYHSTTWEVSGLNMATEEASLLTVSRSQIENMDFQYAMLTLETDISDDYTNECELYPASNPKLRWSNITVNSQRPIWSGTVTRKDCDQNLMLDFDGSVEFSWTNEMQ